MSALQVAGCTYLFDALVVAGAGAPLPAQGSEVGTDEAAIIMYTSGTTGDPKGVVRSPAPALRAHLAMTSPLDTWTREASAGQM